MSGLRKAKKYDWKDSNMALFGSDEDKKVKKESAETEKAWNCVSNLGGAEATFVWRIEKFKVVPWPKEDYGDFFNGDSYIIYNQRPDPENPDAILQDVHFWIGKESTQDEYGTAAYKTVELDTLLDDAPVQHREVQGHESTLFKSYFPSITIKNGGCATGFRHVEPEKYVPRLFLFHGSKKNIQVKEVPLQKSSLDSTDVFILDQGLRIFQWNGETCNKDEKFKAVQYLQDLKSQRHGKATVECLENNDTSESHDFYSCLGDEPKDEEDESDGNAEGFEPCLWSLSDKSGTMEFSKVCEGEIMRSSLDPNDVFILDNGKECFVWVGSKASPEEKKNGLTYAHNYLNKTEHPLIPVSVIKQHGKEPSSFAANFS